MHWRFPAIFHTHLRRQESDLFGRRRCRQNVSERDIFEALRVQGSYMTWRASRHSSIMTRCARRNVQCRMSLVREMHASGTARNISSLLSDLYILCKSDLEWIERHATNFGWRVFIEYFRHDSGVTWRPLTSKVSDRYRRDLCMSTRCPNHDTASSHEKMIAHQGRAALFWKS